MKTLYYPYNEWNWKFKCQEIAIRRGEMELDGRDAFPNQQMYLAAFKVKSVPWSADSQNK